MFRFIFLFLILFFVGFGSYVWIQRVPITQKLLSKALKHETTIEEICFGWEKIDLKKVKIKNPPNPYQPFALQADQVTLKASPLAFFKDKIVIDALKIENLTLGVLLLNNAGTNHNWKLKDGNGSKKAFQINHYTINNLQCEAITCKGKPLKTKSIPHIEFLNLGSKQSQTLSQLNNTVFELILMRLSTAPTLDGLVEAPKKPSPEAKEYFNELFSTSP